MDESLRLLANIKGLKKFLPVETFVIIKIFKCGKLS